MHGRAILASIIQIEMSRPADKLRNFGSASTRIQFDARFNGDYLSPPPMKFHCASCGEGFAEEPQLSLHEKGKYEIPCQFCDSTFFTQSDLKLHMKADHTPMNTEENLQHWSCD